MKKATGGYIKGRREYLIVLQLNILLILVFLININMKIKLKVIGKEIFIPQKEKKV